MVTALHQANGVTVYHGDGAEVLKRLDIAPQLVITSPPYDNLRKYGGNEFDFGAMADAIVDVMPDSGVLVWVVGDSTVNGSETGTSFRQALSFMGRGLKLHDTMIFAKKNISHPSTVRYYSAFEYMFVFVKGKIKTYNLIKDRKNKWAGTQTWGRASFRNYDGTITKREQYTINEYSIRTNIWEYLSGYRPKYRAAYKHPAIFPIELAEDHIVSWTNPGDIVLDPMAGSGTVLQAAINLNREAIGIDIHKPYCELMSERIENVQA